MRRCRSIAVLATTTALALPAVAAAHAGDLDPSFGLGGTPVAPAGVFNAQLSLAGSPLYSFGDGLIVRADGSVRATATAADGSGQQRLTTLGLGANGMVDPAFGTAGVVRGGTTELNSAIAAAPGDKFVVAGTGANGQIVVARYNADGTLDTTFHTTGVFTWTQPPGSVSTMNVPTQANAVAVDASGRVVVAGIIGSAGLIVRLTAAGNLDSSFNSTGFVVAQYNKHTPLPSGDGTRLNAVTVAPDGDVIVAGEVENSSPSEIVGLYAAFTNTGAPDTTVHGNGSVGFQGGNNAGIPKTLINAVIALPDNSVLLAGEANVAVGPGGPDASIFQSDLLVFDPTGTHITGQYQHDFGTPGVAGYGAESAFNALARDSAGRIIAVGYAGNANGDDTNSQVLVARLVPTADALDPTFGNGGFVTTQAAPSNDGSQPGQFTSFASAVAIAPNNKIVIAGTAQDASHADQAMAARYENASTTAIITASTVTPVVHQTVKLDGSMSTGAASPIATYAWDFNNDGTTDATGPMVTTSFPTTGIPYVRLTVTDGDGVTATTLQKITVHALAPVPKPKLKFKIPKLTTVSSSGGLSLPVHCYPPGPCKGSLKLTFRHGRRTLTLGSASVSVAGGKTRSIVLTLNRVGRSLLAGHHGSLSVTATITLTSAGRKPVSVHATVHLHRRSLTR